MNIWELEYDVNEGYWDTNNIYCNGCRIEIYRVGHRNTVHTNGTYQIFYYCPGKPCEHYGAESCLDAFMANCVLQHLLALSESNEHATI